MKACSLFFAALMLPVLSAFAQTPACGQNSHLDPQTSQCVCDAGFITPTNGAACSYAQKQQKTAFLLNFFVGFGGAGMFYAGQNGEGAGQLVLFVVSASLGILSLMCCCVPHDGAGNVRKPLLGISIAGLIGGFGWWLANDIRFGLNTVPDENGYKLQAW